MKNNINSPTKREESIIKIMILLGLFSIANFLFFFFQPEHRGNIFLFILLCTALLYSIVKKLYMWYNYANISVPDIPETTSTPKVDILTTYFPGEPYQMIVTTLEAIGNITYPHTAYLCDEANDPFLKKFCEENGIVHVTRDNRKDAKAGNINNALENIATGDICVILDPDHIPEPDFLEPIVPFFTDPSIGFVQTVQAYYNIKDTLVARGAAEQTFQFYGPMMMTLHSYGTVNAIGANCVFRRKALDSIGGHAPGLCEDMHTAMLLYAKGWKSVYLPEVLAKGLAPSNLTTYFKQQLKWARGTFDLLFNVYPKVFKDLTIRQKIHFGILPLHYLSGIIYLLNFLIPILALFFSITPWEGNIIDFFLALLPVAVSAMLIRAYIQKWVIEKEERGFHITGGLLQINTWWVYILGFLYTVFNKEVPYLPTPKQSEFNTNLKIVWPNAVIALLSIFAIIYGLQKDFTPFSLFMAGLAFFNTAIMLFGIYLAVKVTNQNRILRSSLSEKSITKLFSLKTFLRRSFHQAFTLTRKTALPLLAVCLLIALGFRQQKENLRWKKTKASYYKKQSGKYLGIFYPTGEDGLTDLEAVSLLEAGENINFDIISFYLAWDDKDPKSFPIELMETIAAKNAIPMITWEPWAALLSKSENDLQLQEEKKILKKISEGSFDPYIIDFAKKLADFNHPVYLRFAHEFNNPQYPWSQIGENTPAEFKAAWRHISNVLKQRGAYKVMMVWNPWSIEGMQDYYPGDKYVDWVGFTALNYQQLNQSGESKSFKEIYTPFHEKLYWFTRKPVMLTEFGSLNIGENKTGWLDEAARTLKENFKEVQAVVLFHSAYDKNIPANEWYDKNYLNWTANSISGLKRNFRKSSIDIVASPPERSSEFSPNFPNGIRGVRFNKGKDWKNNYYVSTRNELLKDFEKMRSAGINTIQFKGGNIYDYNILKHAKEKDLTVIYEFDIDFSNSFINNRDYTRDLEEEIIEKVKELKGKKHILGYSFPYNMDPFYTKPLLFKQREAFIEWLHYLTKRIKAIDEEKSLVLDIPLTKSTPGQLVRMEKHLQIDSYGLLVNDSTNLEVVTRFAKEKNIPVHLSSLPTRLLPTQTRLVEKSVILENWQDERLSYKLSFDGLLNFSGQKKKSYFLAAEKFNDAQRSDLFSSKIIKPATPLIPGSKERYSAALFINNSWIDGEKLSQEFEFEWWLVKNDNFKNPLATKKVGAGPFIFINIPEDYEDFELLLSVSRRGHEGIFQIKDALNTPLYTAVTN